MILAAVGVLAVVLWPGQGDERQSRPEPEPGGSEPGEPEQWAPAPRAGDPGPGSADAPEGESLSAMDVEGVGCDGESADDLQEAVEQAVDDDVTLVIPEGAECRLDEPLHLPEDLRLVATGAVVEGLPGEFDPRPDRESLVAIIDVEDVDVTGGVWRMAEDEGANVFEIRDAEEITLRDLTTEGAREDGFYLGQPASEDVTLERVRAHRNGRSGISITTGRDVEIRDSQSHDNGHIFDMRGLAIEPNSDGGPLTGIRVIDFETWGNARSGAATSLSNLDSDEDEVDIVFDGYRSADEPVGLRVSGGFAEGSVRIVDAEFSRIDGPALELEDRWASAFEVEVVRPVIRDWARRPTGVPSHDSAITIHTSDDDVDEPLGAVRITEPAISAREDVGAHAYYLHVGDQRDEPAGVAGVELADPLTLEHGQGLSLGTSAPRGATGDDDRTSEAARAVLASLRDRLLDVRDAWERARDRDGRE